MSTSEPDLESSKAETAPPKLDWRSPRTWAFFVADAAYGGAATGLIVIVACLITGLFYEMKTGSFDGWWLVIVVTVLLSAIHLIIFDRWLLPGKPVRDFELNQALPSGGNGTLSSFFYGFGNASGMSLILIARRPILSILLCGLRIAAGMSLVLIAQRLTVPPDAWGAQMLFVVIFSILNNEPTLLKLLVYRTPNNLGS